MSIASRRAADARATGRRADADRGGRRRVTSGVGIGSPALLFLLPVLLITLGAAPASNGPTVVQVRSAASVVLSDAGGTLNTVESVTLAKGWWTVTSNTTAVNFGPGDFIRCHLDANGTAIDGGETTYLVPRQATLAV